MRSYPYQSLLLLLGSDTFGIDTKTIGGRGGKYQYRSQYQTRRQDDIIVVITILCMLSGGAGWFFTPRPSVSHHFRPFYTPRACAVLQLWHWWRWHWWGWRGYQGVGNLGREALVNQYSISSSSELLALLACAGGPVIIIIPMRGGIGGRGGRNNIIVFDEERHRLTGGKNFYWKSSFLIIHDCEIDTHDSWM